MTMSGDVQEDNALQDALRRAGLRVTPQRMMVLAALAAGEGHMTADEIFDLVRREYPSSAARRSIARAGW